MWCHMQVCNVALVYSVMLIIRQIDQLAISNLVAASITTVAQSLFERGRGALTELHTFLDIEIVRTKLKANNGF